MQVHKVLTLTAKKRDQRGLQNSDKNKLVEIKVKLELTKTRAGTVTSLKQYSFKFTFKSCGIG